MAYGLLFMDGPPWQKRLHALMPVFTRPNISSYVSFMHQYLQQIMDPWQSIQRFPDLFTQVVNMNAGLLMRVGYGLHPDTTLARQLADIVVDFKFDLIDPNSRMDEFGMSIHTLVRLPRFIKAEWRRKRKIRKLRSLITTILASDSFQENEGLNWISSLQQSGFSVATIADEVNHLYEAYSALDYLITCALIQLGRNPEWMLRLKNELSITADLPIGITHKDFEKIPDTVHFMQEIFRYYPATMGVSRRAGTEIITDSVYLPAGQEVLIALYSLHHHPDYWNEPDCFNPDRWKNTQPIAFSYIPFLKGPRHCIGRHLAELNFINFIRVWILNGEMHTPEGEIHLAAFMIPRFEKEIKCTFIKP